MAGEPVVVWEPQEQQAKFITCPADDVGFGGARGGGKSDAVIGDWVNHESIYQKAAIGLAFRRQRTELVELIERAKQVLLPVGHKWYEQDKYFRGPGGGRLRFSYLESDSDADAYQGHSYTRLYPEEMGTFPNEGPINKLQATLRSGQGVPCQMKGTCNPGGPGHQWVKARYQLSGRPITPIKQTYEFTNPFNKEKIEKTRVFIPSRVKDNRYLGNDYVANLYLVGSSQLVDAWLQGDWDVIQGAFFDCWNYDRHVLAPFEIPPHWLRFRSGDWGSAKPASIGWWAVAGDDFDNGRGRVIPRGAIVRYREWYVSSGPNTGLKLTAEQVALGILEREAKEEQSQIKYSVLDPAAFAQDGGPSIAERMATATKGKVGWSRADNKRVSRKGAIGGWDQMRARLVGDEAGRPMAYCFNTCAASIRTIPALQHDPDNPEDLDTDGEDHCFAAGTLIETRDGPVAIEKLPQSGMVRTQYGYSLYKNPRLTRRNAKVVKVKLDNGVCITCTPDHKFLVDVDEWRYASELKGRSILCDPKSLVGLSKNLRESDTTSAADIFNARALDCTGLYGNIATEPSQSVSTSITWTIIAQITRLKILNVFHLSRIWANVMATNLRLAVWDICQQLGLLPQNGTAQWRVRSGIHAITINEYVQLWRSGFPQPASNAGNNTWSAQRKLSRENSAATTAKRVLCVSVEPLKEKQDVYCLTVPDAGHFAIEGGIIVANCGDEWRYACMSRPWVPKQKGEIEPPKYAYAAEPGATTEGRPKIATGMTWNEMFKKHVAKRNFLRRFG